MVVALSNNTYAQELHEDTLYEIAKHTFSNKSSSIPVGKHPTAIGVNDYTNTTESIIHTLNTLSGIDGNNNTKMGNAIPVGKHPTAIGVNDYTNTIYIANFFDNTVSVIDGKSNKVVARVMFNAEPFNSG